MCVCVCPPPPPPPPTSVRSIFSFDLFVLGDLKCRTPPVEVKEGGALTDRDRVLTRWREVIWEELGGGGGEGGGEGGALRRGKDRV